MFTMSGLLYASISLHIHCVYMFYFVGPDIPVIVGVTVGVVGGIPLLIVILVVVAWCGKQKG